MKKKKIILSVLLSSLLLGSVGAASANVSKSNGDLLRIQQVDLENSKPITSTDDNVRRDAIEKEYDIDLQESDYFDVRYGAYTPAEVLKKLGYYYLNANRQELIKYAIRTNDWQPYRINEAKERPAYFEIVDGKYEYSKVYYGNLLENHMRNYNAMTEQEKKDYESIHQSYMNEYLEKFRNAAGVVPYVVHINHTEQLAKQYNVPLYDRKYFNSKYNDPKVMSEGKFSKEKEEAEKAQLEMEKQAEQEQAKTE